MDESEVKYFMSLQLPERSKDYLAEVVTHLFEDHGDVISRPHKRKTYHITLGVMKLIKDKINVIEKVHRQLQELLDTAEADVLDFKDVGWFGDGAVYLKMEESKGYGLLLVMRRILEAECGLNEIEILDMTHFHVTLFKENTIPEESYSISMRGNEPISIPLSAARHMGDDVLIGARADAIDTVELREVKRNH